MSGRSDCDAVRELAPELALGVADGRERAEALAHLATCAACRAHLAELTDLGDDLLALTPAEEPPVGFEERVLVQLGTTAPRRARRLSRAVLALATACLAAVALAVGGWALVVSSRDDRELAESYREALANVGGEYFQAARLHDADGRAVGQVFGYQGRPSWLFVVLYAPYRDAPVTATVTTTGGRTVPLGELELDNRRSTWGGAIPLDLREVETLRLVDRDGDVYRARIPDGPE